MNALRALLGAIAVGTSVLSCVPARIDMAAGLRFVPATPPPVGPAAPNVALDDHATGASPPPPAASPASLTPSTESPTNAPPSASPTAAIAVASEPPVAVAPPVASAPPAIVKFEAEDCRFTVPPGFTQETYSLPINPKATVRASYTDGAPAPKTLHLGLLTVADYYSLDSSSNEGGNFDNPYQTIPDLTFKPGMSTFEHTLKELEPWNVSGLYGRYHELRSLDSAGAEAKTYIVVTVLGNKATMLYLQSSVKRFVDYRAAQTILRPAVDSLRLNGTSKWDEDL